MKVAIVTGSSGLIGSQAVEFLISKGFIVIGLDNHMREFFFGPESSTKLVTNNLVNKYSNFIFNEIDIRDYTSLEKIFIEYGTSIDLIIHTAAQPSHDWASKNPIIDFTINANGTLNLLELTRKYCPKSTFIYTSTNKVYGDLPNKLNLIELDSRFEFFENGVLSEGINENMSIDNSMHSLFGVSKTSADLMCQEYGKYFDMNVGIFRGGCLTGPNHQGTELHGFMSYLIKCMVMDKKYSIFGYKGKQVRDNIHSHDLINAFWLFHNNPKKGEVYNIGGGRENSISIIELINKVNLFLGKEWDMFDTLIDNRKGDHIWYISNKTKFENDYPTWRIEHNLESTINSIISKIYDNGMGL